MTQPTLVEGSFDPSSAYFCAIPSQNSSLQFDTVISLFVGEGGSGSVPAHVNGLETAILCPEIRPYRPSPDLVCEWDFHTILT